MLTSYNMFSEGHQKVLPKIFMLKMKSNLHTHSTFCDGRNTPEEIVIAAINKGFASIGFSSHAYTDFDLRYCMKDTEGYINEIKRLKEKYKNDIEIYLGVEEDAYCPVKRSEFDYIIGSSHYYVVCGDYLPIDSSPGHFKRCLEAYKYDIERMAEDYFGNFCGYINERKPDIVGHFDLITKFDETIDSLFLKNQKYNKVAEKYLDTVADSGCLFEVNTGAISRGYRSAPYPSENLLYILKKHNARIVLSSDSHTIETLDFGFEEAKKMLREVGFAKTYYLYGGRFVAEEL